MDRPLNGHSLTGPMVQPVLYYLVHADGDEQRSAGALRMRPVGCHPSRHPLAAARRAGVSVRPRRQDRGVAADPLQPPGVPARLRPGGGAARGPPQPLRARRSANRARARRPGRPRAGGRPCLLSGRRDRRLLLMSASPGTRRATLQRRIRLLVGATITYNVIEAVVALTEGTRVSSSALIGFGLDSV